MALPQVKDYTHSTTPLLCYPRAHDDAPLALGFHVQLKKLFKSLLVSLINQGELHRKPYLICLVYNLGPDLDLLIMRQQDIQTDEFFCLHFAATQHKAAALAQARDLGFTPTKVAFPPHSQIHFCSRRLSSFC